MKTTVTKQKSDNNGFENETTDVTTIISNINNELEKVSETHNDNSVSVEDSNETDIENVISKEITDTTTNNTDGLIESTKKDSEISNTEKMTTNGKVSKKGKKEKVKESTIKTETETVKPIKSELVTVNIDDLTIHPIHTKIYGESENYDFLKISMEKDKQSLTPPIVNKQLQLIDGVLRFLYCKNDLKCKTIEVVVKDIKEEDILISILKSNIHRKLRCIQILNVFDSFMEYFSHQGKKTSVSNNTEVKESKKKKNGNLSRDNVCKMMNTSYSNIDKMKKIKDFDVELFKKIDEGKKTIHKVYRSIGKKVKNPISDNTTTDYSNLNLSDSNVFKVLKYDETTKMKNVGKGEIQCIVTTPPKFEGEDKDRKQYIENITNRLKECKSLLKDDGSLYLIMEDTHCGGIMSNIPFNTLMGLISFGYRHIDTIIWEYTPQPSICGKNLTHSFKYIFHLTNSLTYYQNTVGRNIRKDYIPENTNGEKELYDKYRYYKGKDWNKVWFSENIIKTNRFDRVDNKSNTILESIPIGLILDSTKEGDYVMNPFDTDESVGLVSLFYDRKFVGFTDSEEYGKIQKGVFHQFLNEYRKVG